MTPRLPDQWNDTVRQAPVAGRNWLPIVSFLVVLFVGLSIWAAAFALKAWLS
jgi:CHASE1-domain containing sensor protein